MRKLGALLLIGGIAVATVYLLYWFFSAVAEDMPVALKVAVALAATGLLLLILSIIRERLKASKEEEGLKGVER
ncbi:MAG: hypothetical protein JSV02_03225 [Dehalococcoidia bacterium]|nr:MAG: hypothetical protein JSV02_03225 [Dehalococcoidia bacterium]